MQASGPRRAPLRPAALAGLDARPERMGSALTHFRLGALRLSLCSSCGLIRFYCNRTATSNTHVRRISITS
jgi:hypothetical protein